MIWLNKMATLDAAIQRYGHIDLSTATWPDAHLWLTILTIAAGKFPNWKVMNTQMPVRAISCNKDLVKPLEAALNSVFDLGFGSLLHTYDGCFNIRSIRGRLNSPSAHSYGLAIDINAQTNPMSSILHTDMSQSFVKCFTNEGFDWGGNFYNRKDPMHFSRCWE